MENEFDVKKEMYAEMCFETGAKATAKGYKEFLEWRDRVDAMFAKRDAAAA